MLGKCPDKLEKYKLSVQLEEFNFGEIHRAQEWLVLQSTKPAHLSGSRRKSRPVSTIHVFVIARLISMKFQRD